MSGTRVVRWRVRISAVRGRLFIFIFLCGMENLSWNSSDGAW